jgi:hypothetical protein
LGQLALCRIAACRRTSGQHHELDPVRKAQWT